jgi:hypothetical protein
MYSGVRPIIRPATNTATMANSSIPHKPEPGAPTITSSTIMLASRMAPLKGRKLSCIASTAPSDDAVETSAKSAEPAMPKRTSLPSMLPPGCKGPGA